MINNLDRSLQNNSDCALEAPKSLHNTGWYSIVIIVNFIYIIYLKVGHL